MPEERKAKRREERREARRIENEAKGISPSSPSSPSAAAAAASDSAPGSPLVVVAGAGLQLGAEGSLPEGSEEEEKGESPTSSPLPPKAPTNVSPRGSGKTLPAIANAPIPPAIIPISKQESLPKL